MDPVTGAVVAAAVAWASIVVVVLLPRLRRAPDPRHVRWLGGATLALFAVQVMGVPLPGWLPVAVFFVGLLGLVLLAGRPQPAPS